MDMNEYYNEMIEKLLAGYKKINGTDQVENKKWELPIASWDVSVIRGKVFEKATVSRVRIHTKHPDTGEDTHFHALQSKVYPVSPRIPILVFIIEHMTAQDDFFSGMMDVIPTVRIEEDMEFLSSEMKKVTAKHGQEHEPLRKKGYEIFKLPTWEKPIGAGAGIHNPTDKALVEMIKEEGRIWLDAYLKIVEKRKDEPYKDEDLKKMNSIRCNLHEWYYLGDKSLSVANQMGVPMEAINLMIAPPTMHY
jgi:coproporphyrinogen III oxidase